MNFKRLLFILLLGFGATESKSQSFDIQQLILDWQKLSELKSILSEMKTGYTILSTGYENIKTIAEGNFSLHSNFLSSLLAVNPAVLHDPHVQDIVNVQANIASEYKSAFSRFSQDKHFTPAEISYLGTVYNNLFNQSLSGITNLTAVITANTLRMSDDERLHAIDGIYRRAQNQLMFLRNFNNSTTMLAIGRATEANDAASAKNLYGLP